MLTDGETASELRLFALSRHFRDRFSALRTRLRRERLRLISQEFVADVLASLFTLGVGGLGLLVMLRRALSGTISLGTWCCFSAPISKDSVSAVSCSRTLDSST